MKRKIEVVKNWETSLVIDDIGTAIEEENILKDGYLKALQALKRYLIQTEKVRDKLKKTDRLDSQINDVLYQSPHNIIAFSGKRGTGKTSAMISYSEFLKSRGEHSEESKSKWKEYYPNLHTLVLSPIDPTMLENDQDILSVVLSRLLYKAEERWNQNSDFHRGAQFLEKEKNELLKKASSCMNGILAVKKKGEIKSLADLQRVGDSAVLKKNLFDFVDLVNVFCLGSERVVPESCLLVLPIDDTDCQIQKAHEVMEDIRRYLTLPNVIILMATDGDMLRNVFAQHYAEEFKTGINRGFLDTVNMEHYAEKYLTKLVPGTQRVYLPVFENVLEGNSAKLELGYYENELKDKDLISGSTRSDRIKNRDNENDIDFNFQAKILTFIFNRTGIVFAEHAAYINNIIPTTMRGLAHLLNYLHSMEEVKEIEYTHDYALQELIETAQERFVAIEKNLDLFEEYFMNEWVPAKVSGDMVRILKGIQEQVPENLIRYAFDEMYDIYIENLKTVKDYDRIRGDSYYRLMEMLGGINGSIENADIIKTFKHKSDFYNTFAVRTLLTIKNNKRAVKMKLDAIKKAGEDLEGKIDYSFFKTEDLLPHNYIGDKYDGQYCKRMKPVVDLYSQLLKGSIVSGNVQTQLEKFCMEELAWTVLCNWEVQDIIYKSVKGYSESEEEKTSEGVMKAVQDAISCKNCQMLHLMVEKGGVQIDRWPDRFNNIYSTEDEEQSDGDSGDNNSGGDGGSSGGNGSGRSGINTDNGNRDSGGNKTRNDSGSDNSGIEVESGTIDQIAGSILRKLEAESVRNTELLTGDLCEMIKSIDRKKKDLKEKRIQISQSGASDEIVDQYDEMINRFEEYVENGKSILEMINIELGQPKLNTPQSGLETGTQIDEKGNALSVYTIEKTKEWLSGVKYDNGTADLLLHSGRAI